MHNLDIRPSIPEEELKKIEATVRARSLEINELSQEIIPLTEKISRFVFWGVLDAKPELAKAYIENGYDPSKLSPEAQAEFNQIQQTTNIRTVEIVCEILQSDLGPEELERKIYDHVFWSILDNHQQVAKKFIEKWDTSTMADKEKDQFANIQRIVDIKREEITPLAQNVGDVKHQIYQQIFWGMLDHREALARKYMEHWDPQKLSPEEQKELAAISESAKHTVAEILGLLVAEQGSVKKVQLLLLQSILIAREDTKVLENLMQGDKGDEVRKLQKILVDVGYLHTQFDKETSEGLANLQKDLGINLNPNFLGRLGPKTRAALNRLVREKTKIGKVDGSKLSSEYLIFPKNLLEGDIGPEVIKVQKLLIELGYLHDGFDNPTMQAVSQLQLDLDLDVAPKNRGKLGPKTRTELNATIIDTEKTKKLHHRQRLRRERRHVDHYLKYRMALPHVVKHMPDYVEQVKADSNRLPEMHEKCRVSVCVPAHLEEKNIEKLLNGYLDQRNEDGTPLDPDTFEINIIVNRQVGIAPDRTVQVIEAFQRKHPNMHINIVDKVFPKTNPEDLKRGIRVASVGTARKYIGDVTLLRSRKTDRKVPLYILTEDADEEFIGPYNISKAITKLDKEPYLDALRGVIDMPAESYMQNDFLLFARRLQDFIEISARNSKYNAPWTWQGIRTGGQDTVFTAEAYSLAGGTPFGSTQGEDLAVGNMIRNKRNTLGTIASVNNLTVSDPRRMLFNIMERGTITTAYGGGKSEGGNFVSDDVRSFDWQKIIDQVPGKKLTEANKVLFEKEAGRFAHLALSIFIWNAFNSQPSTSEVNEAINKGIALFERAMFFMGFKKDDYNLNYSWHMSEYGWPQLNPCTVKFNKIDNIQAALNSYPERYKKRLENDKKKYEEKLKRPKDE